MGNANTIGMEPLSTQGTESRVELGLSARSTVSQSSASKPEMSSSCMIGLTQYFQGDCCRYSTHSDRLRNSTRCLGRPGSRQHMDVRVRLRVLIDRRLYGDHLCLSTYYACFSVVYFAAVQAYVIAGDITQDSVDGTDRTRNMDSKFGLQ